MRIAISTWEGNISPVFDVARSLLVVDIKDGMEKERTQKSLHDLKIARRASYLKQLRINVLVCGALSSTLEERICESGVKVIAFTCGEADEVLHTIIAGKFNDQSFLMPGCRRREHIGSVFSEVNEI